MKKYPTKDISMQVTGSSDIEEKAVSDDLSVTNDLVETLMEKLLESSLIEEELIKIADKPITMLLPIDEKKTFFLFSPALQSFRSVRAPVEAIIIEESNGRETLCIINNIPFMVPDAYLTNVGYN